MKSRIIESGLLERARFWPQSKYRVSLQPLNPFSLPPWRRHGHSDADRYRDRDSWSWFRGFLGIPAHPPIQIPYSHVNELYEERLKEDSALLQEP